MPPVMKIMPIHPVIQQLRILCIGLLMLGVGLLACLDAAASPAQVVPTTEKTSQIENRIKRGLQNRLKKLRVRWGSPVYIRIFKLEHELELWLANGKGYILFQRYPICSFSGKIGPKKAEGDKQAPEGFYTITAEGFNPKSQAYLSLNIGYPNEYDRLNNFTGSAIMIHGGCISTGCFTLGESRFSEDPMWDRPIEEIWTLAAAALNNGQQVISVHVFPFRMDAQHLAAFSASPHYDFWRNLKEGYDFFIEHGVVPEVTVTNNRYCFSLPIDEMLSGLRAQVGKEY
jgi:murein L,D-transpeptidase YafK